MANCFYCNGEVEHSGKEHITIGEKITTFEVFTCGECGKRFLVEIEG